MFQGLRHRVICPVCRLERWVELSDYLQFRNVIQGGFVSLLLMALFYPLLHGRVVVIPVLVFLGLEFFRSALMRQHLFCPRCHYDPYLYKTDRKEARAQCEKRLLEIKNSKP